MDIAIGFDEWIWLEERGEIKDMLTRRKRKGVLHREQRILFKQKVT